MTMQPSLTGSGAKVALICNVAPASCQSEETRNTLLFADGAKRIRVCAVRNEVVDWPLVVKRLQAELADMRGRMAMLSGGR